jgi:NADPH:quinone reductase-like Zn-dependent oxidoreductase
VGQRQTPLPDKLHASMVDAGLLRPVIDTVLPFTDAAKAHAFGETGRITGKSLWPSRNPERIAR